MTLIQRTECFTFAAANECLPWLLWLTYIVGERTGIPLCIMGMAAYLWPHRDGRPPGFVGWERKAYPRMLDALDEARALFGLPVRQAQCDARQPAGDLFLVRSVAELERGPESLRSGERFGGTCEWASPVQGPGVWQQLCGQMAAEWGCALSIQHGRTFEDPSFWRSWSRRWRCVRYGSSSPCLGGAWIAVLAYSHRTASFVTRYRATASCCTPSSSSPEGISTERSGHVLPSPRDASA